MAARRRRNRNRFLENIGGLPRSTMLTFGLAVLLLLASIGIVGATLARRGAAEQAAIDPTAEPTPFVAIVETPAPSASPTSARPIASARTASATSRVTPTAVGVPLGAGPGRAARGIAGSMAVSLGGTLPPPEVAVNPTPTRGVAASGPVAPTPTPYRAPSGGSSAGGGAVAPTPTPYLAPSGGGSSGSGSSGSGSSGSGSSGSGSSGSGSSGSGSSGSGSVYTPPTSTPIPPPPPPTLVPTPVPTPSLPAATLPGPGSRTYSYKFTYSQNGPFAEPASAQAWVTTWRTFTLADANSLKAALGMTGAVEQVGGGFKITGPGTLLINNTLGTISYTAPTAAAKGSIEIAALPTVDLLTPVPAGTPTASPGPSAAPATIPSVAPAPSPTPTTNPGGGTTHPVGPGASATPSATTQLPDAAALAAARAWLGKAGIMPANADAGRVTRPTPEQIVVTFHPQTPGSLIPQDPMIQVKLSADGTVREVYHRWPTNLEPRETPVRDVDAAWREVVAGGGYLEVTQTVPADLPANTVFSGNAVVSKVSIGWAPGTDGTTNYLVPLYVFEGTVTLNNPPAGQPAAVPFRVYIAATAP